MMLLSAMDDNWVTGFWLRVPSALGVGAGLRQVQIRLVEVLVDPPRG